MLQQNSKVHNQSGYVDGSNTIQNTFKLSIGKVKIGAAILILSLSYFFVDIKDVFSNTPQPVKSEYYSSMQPLNVIVVNGKLRNAPTTTSRPIAYLKKGEKVTYLGNKTETQNQFVVNGVSVTEHWLLVEYQDKKGWIFGGCVTNDFEPESIVKLIKNVEPDVSKPSFKEVLLPHPYFGTPFGEGVRMRIDPSLNCKILMQLYKSRGDQFKVISRTTRKYKVGTSDKSHFWFKVNFLGKNNSIITGWIHGSLIEKQQELITNQRPQKKEVEIIPEDRFDANNVEGYDDDGAYFIPRHSTQGIDIYLREGIRKRRFKTSFTIDVPEGVFGEIHIDLCVGKTGKVLLTDIIWETTTIEDSTFLKQLEKELKLVSFSEDNTKSCGLVEIKIRHKISRNR